MKLALVLSVALLSGCVVTVEDGDKSPPDSTPTDVAPATATATAAASVATTATASAQPTLPNFGKVCTRAGCTGALTVAVEGGDKLAKGKYLIEVEADGKKGSCTFAAPGFCGDKAPKCGGDVEISVITAGCDKASEKGAAPAVISELKLPSSPKAATITVSRDGKKVGELKSAPQYKEVRPNGPDCDPVCKLGDDKLTVR